MKRRAFKLLLFLLAGAVINVAVAWGCVVSTARLFGEHDNEQYTESAFEYNGMKYIYGLCEAPTYIRIEIFPPEQASGVMHGPEELPYWTFPRTTKPSAFAPSDNSLWEQGWGWPCISMFTSWILTAGGNGLQFAPVHGGWSPKWLLENNWQYIIPLKPAIRGFAINTIFYAAILWALFAVPGAVRRRVRIKRGQCASCGYSLRGSANSQCPECGAPVSITGDF